MGSATTIIIAIALTFSIESLADGRECSVILDKARTASIDLEYLRQWKALFDESERLEDTSAGRLYNEPMLKSHNAFFSKVFESCKDEAQKTGEIMFLAISVVSKSGVIEEFLTFPPKIEYQCFVNGIVGKAYPPPPSDQYPIGFMVFFDDPGGHVDEGCVRELYDFYINTVKQTPNKRDKSDAQKTRAPYP